MAIRKIREIGDPVLNKRCKEVTEITPRDPFQDAHLRCRQSHSFRLVQCLKHIVDQILHSGRDLRHFLTQDADAERWQLLQVIGPAEASIGRINDLYRHVFYMKHPDYQVLVEIKDNLERLCKGECSSRSSVLTSGPSTLST